MRHDSQLITQASRPYQICVHCVMDTSDPNITFDKSGVCNHCYSYASLVKNYVWTPERAKVDLPLQIERIKADGNGREYDCILGISGGVDSTYLLYKAVEFGLRPLAIHVDNGWNTAISVSNIKNAITKLGVDLYTEVLDWEEFRDLQFSFLKASTPDSEVPTDHAIIAVLLKTARKNKCRWILSGGNMKTEGILPAAWSTGAMDWKYIRLVHSAFGTSPLKKFPHLNYFDFLRIKSGRFPPYWFRLLNCFPYNRSEAIDILTRDFGWKDYGGKHGESVYTRFFQSYILPTKWGYDKRRAHLSSMINSGELSREKALDMLKNPSYPDELILLDKGFVAKKFNITDSEFDEIMSLPRRTINDYGAYQHSWIYQIMKDASKRLTKR